MMREATHLEVEEDRNEGSVANFGDGSDGRLVRARTAEDGGLGRWSRERANGLLHESAELHCTRLIVPVLSTVVRTWTRKRGNETGNSR